MKPGPKLDALIVEKIMGFTPIKDDDGTIISFIDEPNETEYFYSDDECEFSPSTDISDAWMIVEKSITHFVRIVQAYNKTFYAEFSNKTNGLHGAYAETAPLAICLAALKSIGMEEEIK